MSHEMHNLAGAEPLIAGEGNTGGAAMRGPVALPGSKATSRKKGLRRNLRDLLIGHGAQRLMVRGGKARSRSH